MRGAEIEKLLDMAYGTPRPIVAEAAALLEPGK
jgi:hypothetical protein